MEYYEMLTPGYESRVQGSSPYQLRHTQLKRAVDEAGARFRAADPKLNEARAALLAAVAVSVDAQKNHGNVASVYVDLIRESNTRSPRFATDLPACTEELDAALATAYADFAAARKEYDNALCASCEANKAFGQHEGMGLMAR
jgi:hypothetical protein